MEPQIRYVRSADGTSIATRTLGEAGDRPPVVVLPPPSGAYTTPAMWATPEMRAGVEHLAERRRVVLFDARGTGLSEREVTDFSLDACVADLGAVVGQAADGAVDLIGPGTSAPIVIAYAVRQPERVRRLVLATPVACGTDLHTPPSNSLIRGLMDIDFDLFLRTNALHIFGWTESGRRMAEASSGNITADVWRMARAAADELDVVELLGHVRCPTLVVYLNGQEWIPPSAVRRIAATIPRARLVLLDGGSTPFMFVGDPENEARIMLEFLDEDAPTSVAAPLPAGTAVILFADIVDSTALTERMGDAAFRSQAREVDGHLRAIIREHGGAVVEGKVLGDGVMAVFTSTARAIECALAGHDATLASGLQLRIGLHAGDVIREQNNVFGGAVNIAARISGLAAPGEVLVSDIVRGLARTSAGVVFEDRGEHALKGVADAQRVFAVRAAGGA